MEKRYGLRKVFFIDNAFNIPNAHAKELCQALIAAEDIKTHWNTCLAPFDCDPELLRLMKQAGCALVIMGGMRGDRHDGSGLRERLEPMVEACRRCEEQDLHYTISITFGEPGDTRQTVQEKLDFLRSIKPSVANLRIGVSIVPGTDVAKQALAEGLIEDESDLIKPTFYLTESVRDWIVDDLQAEVAKHPRWNLF
jgi:hypothetical protein